MSNRNSVRPYRARYTALALALSMGLSGVALAQSTTGSIFGDAPAGSTVLIQNSTGFSREIAIDASGHYNASSLPVGTYTVTLQNNGQTVDSRSSVTLRAGAGTDVSFANAANAQNLGAISVTANSLPAIDVSSVDSRTVITAQQLAKLPLARSAESIALLAPGAVQGSGYFVGPNGNRLVSFGGSSVTENAYYINGFNTTDPLSGFGGITLPYGAIDQEEVLTGGYDAQFGRSDGGVISMIGKRGTNEWHFGGQVQWSPAFAESAPMDYYYPNNGNPRGGQIYRKRSKDSDWTAVVDAYVGGPLIKDKLYFFAATEASRNEGNDVYPVTVQKNYDYKYTDPKSYVKLDWNINDSNVLEFTHIRNKHTYEAATYDFDYDNNTTGAFNSYDTSTKTSAKDNIVKYTGYLTDDLTISAMYGKQKIEYYSETPGYDATVANILGAADQNPALNGGTPIVSSQVNTTFTNPAHKSTNTNLRFDVSYHLGDHTLMAGIDNQDSHDIDDGQSMTGPGYAWDYGHVAPGQNISDQPSTFIDTPSNYAGGAEGYYVGQYVQSTAASVRVKQRAQYVQDNWQISDRWLVKLGLRNDQFSNYNPAGDAFLRLTTPQWAPRLGFSWDVFGDSTFKVYGNAGRYYLAMPASVALRGAAGSVLQQIYYTYTGIDANGVPTGLTPINTVNGPGQPVSVNLEYGVPPDPNTVAARNIESEHQDEYVLGFDKQLNQDWTYGAKGIVRKLQTGLDDICDPTTILNKAASLGYDPDTLDVHGCYLSNPGKTNVYSIVTADGGYVNVPVTADDFGMTQMKRNYYALNAYLEHPFDGKWHFRVDYTFSRSYGNSEGQVRSDIGQSDVSATVDWDYGYFSAYSNGDLANDRRHQLKAYGSYQITPEWMVAGVLQVASGTPKSCLGYYGADETNPTGSGPYYHFCDGQPSRPGDAGRNPWTEILSLNTEYRPAFADHKLAFNVYVFNLLNQRRLTQVNPIYGSADATLSNWQRPVSSTTARYVRFGVSYDF